MGPLEMFERAAVGAATLARSVQAEQLGRPTPCSEWDVAALLDHMAGGPAYLLGALGVECGSARWPDAMVVTTVLAALAESGALERRCLSPAGFEWSIAEATAGTAMDQLVHTWDLAVALDVDRSVDAAVADAIVTMFLPHMPDVGRQVGLVGPAVDVAPGASSAEVLLGAMGRDPRR